MHKLGVCKRIFFRLPNSNLYTKFVSDNSKIPLKLGTTFIDWFVEYMNMLLDNEDIKGIRFI